MSDRRPTELTDNILSTNLLNHGVTAFLRDPYRGLGLETGGHRAGAKFYLGKIVYSVPYANCYRVQLDGLAGR